jgi:polyisoprenoid-binding protein YceI
MAPSGQLTEPALQELLRDGKLAGTWALDPAQSQVGLRSKSVWGLVTVKGTFREVTGDGTIGPDGQVTGTISMAATSVDTGNKKRDTHLRSADFFDAANQPNIVFSVDGIAPAGQGVTVTGSLTVRGSTQPLTFDAAVSRMGDDDIVLDAEVQVNRGDFGLTWNQLGMTSMHSTITVHTVFTRQ